MENKIEKPKAGKSRKKITAKQREARRRNIVQYRESIGGSTATKSGVFTVIRSGGREMPAVPYAGEIKTRVDGRIAQYVQDLGGQENVTAGQQIILDGVRTCLLVQGLCEAFLNESGIVDKRRRPHGLLKTLATYVNSARLGAVTLGLERKARRVGSSPTTFAEYLEVRGDGGASTKSAIDTAQVKTAGSESRETGP